MDRGTERSELTAVQRQGLERLEACAREGVTIRAYAKRLRLSEPQLYQMAKVLRGKGLLPPSPRGGQRAKSPRALAVRKPRFVEVQTTSTAPVPSSSLPATWRAQLPNGIVLEGSSGLAGVIEVLARL